MENLLKAVYQKQFQPGEIFAKVRRLRSVEKLPVTMILDAESGQWPLVAKIRLVVPGATDIILYLPRHNPDGSIPKDFSADRYTTRTNVSFDTGRQLIHLLQTLLDQPH
jgi:hypothetical protein